MPLSVGIIGRVIGYAFGALVSYVTIHLFAEHEYGLSVAFAGSFFAVMGWAHWSTRRIYHRLLAL